MAPASQRQHQRICPNCNTEFSRPARPGRPPTHCSDRCRIQARGRAQEPPDLSGPEADLAAVAEDLNKAATGYLAAVQAGEDAPTLMARLNALRRLTEDNEAAVIRRGRARGDTWQTIAADIGVTPDRLRKKWPVAKLERRLTARRAAQAQLSPDAVPSPRGALRGRQADAAAAIPADSGAPPTMTPAQQLASALSFIQRQTGKTFKETAREAGISPSYVSRMLAGGRLPRWEVVETFTAVCGGNLDEILELWRAAQRPAGRRPAAGAPGDLAPEDARREFRTTLRALYTAAGRPDLWSIQSSAAGSPTINEIARTINGVEFPDWATTARVVTALRGCPAELRPLWHAAHRTPPSPGPRLPAAAFG